jgi:hypothetical protein
LKDLETALNTIMHYWHGVLGSFSACHYFMTEANARANHLDEQRNETLDYLLVPNDHVLLKEATFVVVPFKAATSWYWSYLARQWPNETKGGYRCDFSFVRVPHKGWIRVSNQETVGLVSTFLLKIFDDLQTLGLNFVLHCCFLGTGFPKASKGHPQIHIVAVDLTGTRLQSAMTAMMMVRNTSFDCQ